MSKILDDIIRIRDAADVSSSKSAIEAAFQKLGFERMCLAVNKRGWSEFTESPEIYSFEATFYEDYVKDKIGDIDQNRQRSMQNDCAFWFGPEENRHDRNVTKYNAFMDSYGMANGIAMSWRSTSGLLNGLLLTTSTPHVKSIAVLENSMILAAVASMKLELLDACRHVSAEESVDLRQLSTLQLEILRWSARGKSNSDIAVIMELSPRSIKYHMSSVQKKLGVASKAQAIALYAGLKEILS